MEAVQTAIKVKTALSSVGSNPFGEAPKSVKGEDTDSLITGLSGYILVVVALGGIISAGMQYCSSVVFILDSIAFKSHQLLLSFCNVQKLSPCLSQFRY